jgi:hypothetical protein
MLVHRKVFEQIMQKQPLPLVSTQPYPFFSKVSRTDEDIVFCERAQAAGVQPLLDTEVRAGHIGLGVWNADETQPVIKMRGDAGVPPPD